ncbi:MAG: RluA family pseudouridine synthase [Deltaproteobacteria bacterium]|nr:RluA family pseudouridine synthase [Deltaproteobacteria bacterium]
MAERPPPRLTVLYRDPHWLCLDKPPGIPTTPSGPPSLDDRSVVGRARAIAPKAALHHPFSRLDTQVSGVILLGLSHHALDLMEDMKNSGITTRKYLGILSGVPTLLEGCWNAPIGVDPRDPKHRVAGGGRDLQPAETRYRVLAVASSGPARVELVPVTGRTHQLRVHAKAAGAPVLGDAVYGGPRRVTLADGRVEAVPRALLHAWRCLLPGTERVLEAPPPEDLERVWRALAA